MLGFSLWRQKLTNCLSSRWDKWRSIFPLELKLVFRNKSYLIFLALDEFYFPRKQLIQGEHKVFPWLQTFITRKLRGIQIYIYIYIYIYLPYLS